MITRVVPASITGHGVDNPSLTGSSEIVTISVYFACFLKYSRGQKKSFHLAIRVMAPHGLRAANRCPSRLTAYAIFLKMLLLFLSLLMP